ncbi:MAG: DUF4445 domain-containing protein [Oscillospiraceae bacterium]|nr:DUF4445 domain-containing protein [Oscillospiraceae bacterium]
MKKIEVSDFNVKINKERVLLSLGCYSANSIYDTVCAYFDELLQPVQALVSPVAVVKIEDMTAYCLITLGEKISEYSKSLFDKGEGMKGMLVNAMADDYLFETDAELQKRIKLEGAIEGFGIKKRLEAPGDFPLSEQKIILEKTNIKDVDITEAFMYTPAKTLGYILKLTDDRNIFNAEHNCSECTNLDCPRRNITGCIKYSVLSEYDYKSEMREGDSAVCIDIGTTTVVFELVTDTGTLKVYKTINPQRRFGTDVLSRIDAANRGREKEMASLIRYTLLNGYKEVTNGYGDTKKVVISGNTTMVHLLMNYSCRTLGIYPFRSEHLETIKTTFDVVTDGDVAPVETIIYGGISAFVGGDIVSGLYMCDFDISDKVNMFIDLGTNGEMAIGNSNGIIATSTAAGPAFEGGRISCGTGSVDGAICGVDLKKGTLKTIGDKPPVGLCGTGIIELVSELLQNNIIDNTGLLDSGWFANGYKVIGDIIFTQDDIRQVQMAKAAVRAGIEVLIVSSGVRTDDIDTVYLAGGFSHGLSVEKACNIGILPPEFKEKTKIIGNSSLGGCVKYCSCADADKRIEHIKNISKEISLAANEDFNQLYIKYMNFTD